jgi:hypothetical protein
LRTAKILQCPNCESLEKTKPPFICYHGAKCGFISSNLKPPTPFCYSPRTYLLLYYKKKDPDLKTVDLLVSQNENCGTYKRLKLKTTGSPCLKVKLKKPGHICC